MIVATITGRNRQTVIEQPDGEPVHAIDTSPLVIRASNARSLLAEGASLVDELHDAPDAVICVKDGEHVTNGTLHDFLLKCGVKLPA